MTPPKRLESSRRRRSATRGPTGRVVAAVAAVALAACADPEPAAPDGPPGCVSLPEEVTWFSGAGSNDWSDVLVDSRNRVWLAGYAGGVIRQSNIEPSGNSRAVLRVLAPDGRLLWESGAAFDTAGTDAAEALALSAAGNVVVAGRTTGQLGGAPNSGQFDTFVAWSAAADPSAPWRFFQGGTERPQHPRRLAVGADGHLQVAGYDDDYVPSNYVDTWSDPFTTRLERRGVGSPEERLESAWHHQFSTLEPDFVEGLAAGPDGATYVSGQSLGAGGGMFVRKLDSAGRVLWTTRYSARAVDSITALQASPDGTLLLAGNVLGSFQGGAWLGEQDIVVARIAADDGRVLARWQLGSAGADAVTDLKVDGAGNVVLLGETTGTVAPGARPAGGVDLFLLKLSPAGQVLSARQWGTPDDEAAGRLALDSCGGVVAVGSSTGERRSGVLWFWR